MIELLLVVLLTGGQARIQAEVYVDVGACPFECCQYGQWVSTDDVVLYAQPDPEGEAIGTLPSGVGVIASTGEVHTVPGEFRVHREHGRYRPGDVITVYTYLGEGSYRVKFGGEIYEEDLGFGPRGVIPDSRCSDRPTCFGELREELEYVWWIELRVPDGSRAWTRSPESFRGKDACGD